MGDRCHMTLSFGGHIEDRATLEKVVGALAVCGARPLRYLAPMAEGKRQPALLAPTNFILWCFVSAELPEYEFEEVNYARLDCVHELHALGLDVLTNNSPGSEYPGGTAFFDGLTKEGIEWTEHDEDRIRWSEVEAIINSDAPAEARLEAIRGAIEEQRRVQTIQPRELTFGPDLEKLAVARITALRMTGDAA